MGDPCKEAAFLQKGLWVLYDFEVNLYIGFYLFRFRTGRMTGIGFMICPARLFCISSPANGRVVFSPITLLSSLIRSRKSAGGSGLTILSRQAEPSARLSVQALTHLLLFICMFFTVSHGY